MSAKASNKVNWTFIRLVLLQMGLTLPFVNRIMGYSEFANFLVLINDLPSSFFRASRGIWQGCPLSPLLILIIAKGLSRMIVDARRNRFI